MKTSANLIFAKLVDVKEIGHSSKFNLLVVSRVSFNHKNSRKGSQSIDSAGPWLPKSDSGALIFRVLSHIKEQTNTPSFLLSQFPSLCNLILTCTS